MADRGSHLNNRMKVILSIFLAVLALLVSMTITESAMSIWDSERERLPGRRPSKESFRTARTAI